MVNENFRRELERVVRKHMPDLSDEEVADKVQVLGEEADQLASRMRKNYLRRRAEQTVKRKKGSK